jgi:hypothetical protein
MKGFPPASRPRRALRRLHGPQRLDVAFNAAAEEIADFKRLNLHLFADHNHVCPLYDAVCALPTHVSIPRTLVKAVARLGPGRPGSKLCPRKRSADGGSSRIYALLNSHWEHSSAASNRVSARVEYLRAWL